MRNQARNQRKSLLTNWTGFSQSTGYQESNIRISLYSSKAMRLCKWKAQVVRGWNHRSFIKPKGERICIIRLINFSFSFLLFFFKLQIWRKDTVCVRLLALSGIKIGSTDKINSEFPVFTTGNISEKLTTSLKEIFQKLVCTIVQNFWRLKPRRETVNISINMSIFT